MALLGFYKKLSKKELEKAAKKVETWFKDNPRRRVCHTDLYEGLAVRKNHIREDLEL